MDKNKATSSGNKNLKKDAVGDDGFRKQFEEIHTFFESRLKRRELVKIQHELKKRFPLSKIRQVFKKRIRRRGCARNPGLSNTRKKALGLFDISKKGMLFKDVLPLHEMWKKYMDNYLGLQHLKDSDSFGDISSPSYEEITQLLWKADYHGAYLTVSESTSPSLVGIEGILIFETKNMVKLLGTDNVVRCVPKMSCRFKLKLGEYDLNFLGKNFLVKPAERSLKKLKGIKSLSL